MGFIWDCLEEGAHLTKEPYLRKGDLFENLIREELVNKSGYGMYGKYFLTELSAK